MTDIARLFDLTGKVALVTGAGSGLGRTMAAALAAAGAHVVAADLHADRVEETRAQLERDNPGRITAMQLDVTESKAVEAGVGQVAADRGRIDILVNSAGVTVRGRRVHETSDEDWSFVTRANLDGTFYCCRAVIPHMLKSGGGSIITIASIIGVVGHYPGFAMASSAYAASKAGVIGLTRQIAAEYAAEGIRANAIAPGWHGPTRLGERYKQGLSNAEISRFEDTIIAGTPMGRRGLPDELQGLTVYLASGASSFLTGQVIVQDGGWTVT